MDNKGKHAEALTEKIEGAGLQRPMRVNRRKEIEAVETWKRRAEMYEAGMKEYYAKYHACLNELTKVKQEGKTTTIGAVEWWGR